jgi:hypothetical protein
MYSFNPLDKIPSEWIYDYYLNIKENYNGRTIKIKSPFTDEITPSFCIYKRNNEFLFNDFSYGFGGDGVKLVQKLLEKKLNRYVSLTETETTIVKDYNKYIKDNGEYIRQYENLNLNLYHWVCDYNLRPFNQRDYEYWYKNYNINNDILNKYNVKAVSNFKLYKKYNNNYIKSLPNVSGDFIYIYLTKDNIIHTIYQPFSSLYKFIKLFTVIYGEEQLKSNADYLIIGSSLKDIMAMDSMSLPNLDFISGVNENVLLKKEKIVYYKKKYKHIFTLLDNDATGIKSMQKYKNIYNIPFLYLPFEKDFTDSVKVHGIQTIKNYFITTINKKINE